MADISLITSRFINKAQSKMIELSQEITGSYDYKGWQQDSIDDKILLRYELSEAIKLLLYNNNRLTDKEILTLIDWLSVWADLNNIVLVTFSNYQIVQSPDIIVQSGQYALQTSLTAEISARALADAALSLRILSLENNQIDTDDILPNDFYDNQVGSTVNVWDDDPRLHTHPNKAILDQFTDTFVTLLEALQAHYDSIGQASSMHITSSERIAWNAKLNTSDLSALSTVYAALSHTHSTSEITGLDSIINQINIDIAAAAGDDGDDGKQIELYSPDGDEIQWRYVGDATYISLGSFKGDDGEGFVIDARGEADDRYSNTYDAEPSSFAYLAEDTGYLYFRNPTGGTATTDLGWSTGIKFLGNNGWSPLLGIIEVSDTKSVFYISDWIGGEGTKPVLDPGEIFYIGAGGVTTSVELALNVKGPQGASGGGPVIGDAGTLAERDDSDDEATGFIYLVNDVVPAVIYIKDSDADADWGGPYPWQGASGVGTPGPAGPGTKQNITKSSHGFVIGNVLSHNGTTYIKFSGTEDIVGIVSLVPDANNFTVQHLGLITSLTGLTAGSAYYAQSDGTIGLTPTDFKVLLAISTTSGYILAGTGSAGSSYTPPDPYADITALLADQGNQDENVTYHVTDATTDTSVDAESAGYRYKGTTVGDLTDYIKVYEGESLSENILTSANFFSAVRGVLLTGYTTITAATISATDSILDAFRKLQAQISLRLIITSNLSDLDDIPTARTNLDVFSKAETNSLLTEELTTINLELDLSKDTTIRHTVSGAINFTLGSSPTPKLSKKAVYYLVADGINVPTFGTGFIEKFNNYDNTINVVNRVYMEYIGNDKVLYEVTYV